ncbi:hypothetical protein AB1Y20_013860 [Prymnesium parvum]|uniref:Uncharacterized protein n=1 Tax=Prymnesium parvum TaxID=97485 RepID=A0AB34IGP6_PRYPA
MVRHSESLAHILDDYKPELDEIYTHYAGSPSAALPRDRFLAFGAAFDIAPGYLSVDVLEDVYEKALAAASSSHAHTTGRSHAGMAPADFDEALCLLSLAIGEKQWRVEYAADKRARYQYTQRDAEKTRAPPAVEEQLEHLLLALELHEPALYRKRAGISAASPLARGERKSGRKTPPASPISPSSLDARLRSMDFRLDAESEPPSPRIALPSALDAARLRELLTLERAQAADAALEAAFAGGLQEARGGRTGEKQRWRAPPACAPPPSVPPACGAGRASRAAAAAHPSPTAAVAPPPRPPSGGGLAPAPPAGRPKGARSSSAARSPRRVRVAAAKGAAPPAGALHHVPTPPSSPRPAGEAACGRGGTPGRNKENFGAARAEAAEAWAARGGAGGGEAPGGRKLKEMPSGRMNGAAPVWMGKGAREGATHSNLEYFALDARGGEAVQLSEHEFVGAVLMGGTEKQRKRSHSFNKASASRKGSAGRRAASTGRAAARQHYAW